jgi:hypothetical protein
MPRKPKSADTSQLSDFWKKRLEEMDADYQRRLALVQAITRHPSDLVAREVKTFGFLGLPKRMTAAVLWMDEKALEMHYADDYLMGEAEMISRVSENMVRIATSDHPQAGKVGMDILARRGGNEWRPPAQKIKLEDDRDLGKNVIDSSKLTPDQRQQLREMIEGALEREGAVVGDEGLLGSDQEGEA